MYGGNVTKKMKLQSKGKANEEMDESREPSDVMPVLADAYTSPLQLLDVYVTDIVLKRETSRLVRELSSSFPLPNLQHIKRVKAPEKPGGNLQIIVATLDSVSHLTHGDENVSTQSLFKESSISVNTNGLNSVSCLAKVPLGPLLTRKQFKESKKIWPCLFHEDKWLTAALNGTLWTTDEIAFIRECIQKSISSASQSQLLNQRPVGAVIVDPATNSVLALAHDKSGDHPLQHAVMICIDLVAKSQGGGAWALKEFFHAAAQRVRNKKCEKKEGPYLCSGYDLYTNKEPCVMCAMALVHSRIGRVFYGCESADGALGSAYKIHTQKGLNHHFQVFKIASKSECSDLMPD